MGPPSSLSMINLYIFPSSSRYPFNIIKINGQLWLVYLKLKEIFTLCFCTSYLKKFYSCSPISSSARFYSWIDIGILSTLSFTLFSLDISGAPFSVVIIMKKGGAGRRDWGHMVFCLKITKHMLTWNESFILGESISALLV